MTGSGSKNLKTKLLIQMGTGFVSGALGMTLFLVFVGEPALDLDDPSVSLAVFTGIVYAVMGLGVAFGVIAPRAGARFLNVEDADEIREERRDLAPSSAACFLIGAFLLLLAFAPDLGGAGGGSTLFLLAIACLAAVLVISIAMRGRGDELVRQIGIEASALAMHISLGVLSVWAALAQFGYVGWMDARGLIAGLALLELVAIFWLSTKKGLMKPR